MTEQTVYEFSENKKRDDATRNTFAEMIVDQFGYVKRVNEHAMKCELSEKTAQLEEDYDPAFPKYDASVGSKWIGFGVG